MCEYWGMTHERRSSFLGGAMRYTQVAFGPQIGSRWLDTRLVCGYSLVSRPIGPLSQGMLSLGGFFTFPGGLM